MVLSIVKSGMIWTSPPIETVIRVSTTIRMTFFSIVEWRMNIARLLGREYRAGTRGDRFRFAANRAPHVVGHDQAAAQEEHAPQQADRVEWLHCGHRLEPERSEEHTS